MISYKRSEYFLKINFFLHKLLTKGMKNAGNCKSLNFH